MPPCLALSSIRSGSRAKWSNPGNGVLPSSTPQCGAIEKGAFGSPLTMIDKFYFYIEWKIKILDIKSNDSCNNIRCLWKTSDDNDNKNNNSTEKFLITMGIKGILRCVNNRKNRIIDSVIKCIYDIMVIIFTQPLRLDRIWHKVNF